MSGFEIAGIVLGVMPIVINALSAYQAGRGPLATLRKSRGLLDVLIHKLTIQQGDFYFDMLELLREARVPEILAETDPTLERCAEILQVVKTGDEVERYLGPQLFGSFLGMLRFYETYLKQITSKLSHIVRPRNAAKDDLAAVIRASRCPDSSLIFKGKLRFAMDRESLAALVNDLEAERHSLGRLVRRVKTKREWEASEPTRSSKTLTLAFSRVRESASSLYRAVCECWACDRHQLHTLMIRLEHRIPGREGQAARSSAVAFRLLFPVEGAVLQRIEIAARCSDPPTKKTAVRFQNNTPSVAVDGARLKVPSITVTEIPNVPYPTATRVRIRSICGVAREAQERQRVLSLELTSYTTLEAADKDDKSPHSYDKSISLADYLRDAASDADARMSPIEQTLLALNVVSSVLQLRPTMWCSEPWNSATIKFPVQAVGGARATLYTPYVEKTIEPTILGTQEGASPDLTTETAKSTMLELAILLLEILHHKSIAAWAARYDRGDPRTYQERMGAATRWLELSTSVLLPPHVKAVEECLVLCARSKLLWDDYFQRLYCENIIKPLQELVL
ncbi:hypothetical protein MAPG_07259 [Magnaporthiopsis poae ATCC 64411]|uniref:DUF7580 domain-containing protein n=1 Tax=Magnaporthiopsis poae (strain ATCC 64411 / 73-15) TaxID=644358 RepID=A0A0C4E470_MAGP6|nr:hypothetical protein MAPG_07259 [Magnaporthiopsis poae ATCC 64411]